MTQVTLNNGSVDSAGSLKLRTNGTTDAVTIDTAQNVGVGVTPSAWGSPFTAIDMGNSSFAQYNGSTTIVGYNSYADKYKISSAGAGKYQISGNGHSWNIAGSGTAGNTISFTQAMTLSAGGNLGVGTTTPLSSANKTIINAQNAWGGEFVSSVSGVAHAKFGTDNYGSGISCRIESLDGIVFKPSGVEAGRFDSSGNLLVGTTSSAGRVTVYADSGVGQQIQVYQIAPTVMQFRNSQNSGGSITIASGGGTTYGTSSDYRLKHDIQPMVGALAKVSALRPVTYKWNVDASVGEGFVAHELAEICPLAVVGEKDGVDAEGNPKYQEIDTSFLVATLTAAIQEQQAIIQTLTQRVEALEGAK